jgi:hypothetical protein
MQPAFEVAFGRIVPRSDLLKKQKARPGRGFEDKSVPWLL